MQIFKILAAFLAVATLGIIGCGNDDSGSSSETQGQYAAPGDMNADTGDMADPADEGGEEEAPAEEAAEEAPAEEAAEGEG